MAYDRTTQPYLQGFRYKLFEVGRRVFEGVPKALQKTEFDLVMFRPFYVDKFSTYVQ
jgi:hypothetical protein